MPHLQVKKGKVGTSWPVAGLRLFMEWLQLFLIIVNPQYGYDINTTNLYVE